MKINKEAYKEMIDQVASMDTCEWLTQGLDPIVSIDVEEDTNQKELIEQDLDSQPDDNQLDEFISNLGYPEVIPSCKTYEEWFNSQHEILEMIRTGYADYVKDYRKELREWWFKRKQSRQNG